MKPVIVCFAGDVWAGNPHSRHHLMRRLTPEFEVLFVESVPMRSIAREAHELRRIARKLRAGWALRTVAPSLHVLRPLPIPPAGRVGRRAQAAMLRLQVNAALRRLKLHGPRLLWISVPIAAPLVGRLGERGSLFYYQDRYDAFTHVDAEWLRAQVDRLVRTCDVCVATAEPLADDLRALGAEPTVVRHGVEAERFSVEAPVPEDLASLQRPLVGCVGLIDDHMQLDAIVAVADRLEDGTVVVVGDANTSVDRLRHPRIALLGRRPYAAMPAYIAAFDCCLVPFAVNRLTEAVNPIKLREYLAAGRPVVATPLPEVLPYAELVELAGSPAEFFDGVMAALAPTNDEPAARRRRQARVEDETWDAAAAHMRRLLRGLLG